MVLPVKSKLKARIAPSNLNPPRETNLRVSPVTLNSTDSYIIFKGEEEVLQPSTTYRFSIFANAISSGVLLLSSFTEIGIFFLIQ